MIRRISLLFLLANSTVALAQPLYKWVEPDGSITFAPQPPAGGISYERLGTADDPSGAADKTAGLAGQDSPSTVKPPSRSPVSPPEPLPRVEYAPGNASDLPPAISRSGSPTDAGSSLRPTGSALAVSQPRTATEKSEQADDGASVSAANFKQSRCQDLKKRVTSLERRLKSRLTPEDMDNTVIHMARYQRSFDQYCAQ